MGEIIREIKQSAVVLSMLRTEARIRLFDRESGMLFKKWEGILDDFLQKTNDQKARDAAFVEVKSYGIYSNPAYRRGKLIKNVSINHNVTHLGPVYQLVLGQHYDLLAHVAYQQDNLERRKNDVLNYVHEVHAACKHPEYLGSLLIPELQEVFREKLSFPDIGDADPLDFFDTYAYPKPEQHEFVQTIVRQQLAKNLLITKGM